MQFCNEILKTRKHNKPEMTNTGNGHVLSVKDL